MEKQYLIGADKYNNVVYANMEIREWNNKRTFSTRFYSYEPFNADEFDFEDYYEMWCDGLDGETLYGLCRDYDCAPSELTSNLANDVYDVHEVVDTNGEEVEVDGESWAFQLLACGQHDTSDQMEKFINKEAYDMIMNLWKNYHLKEVDDETVEQMNKIDALLGDVNEDEWLENYIRETYL